MKKITDYFKREARPGEHVVLLGHGDRQLWGRALSAFKRDVPFHDADDFETAMSVFLELDINLHSLKAVLAGENHPNFFSETLPYIIELALERAPKLFPSGTFPVLVPQVPASLSLDRRETSALIAQGFLCLIATEGRDRALPHFEFSTLLYHYHKPCHAKLEMIINYFERVLEMEKQGVNIMEHKVTYTRKVVLEDQMPDWRTSKSLIKDISVEVSDEVIENIPEAVSLDFANKFVGGGVLGGGAVQEEILFCTNPECLVALLFMPFMQPNEAIFIHGAERFSDYTGYGGSLKYGGNHVDKRERDTFGRIQCQILALDALQAYSMDVAGQLAYHRMKREMNKLYAGLSLVDASEYKRIATGNWGCGAFGGDHQLKAILQIMTCAHVGRDLVYCTFHNSKLSKLEELIGVLNKSSASVDQILEFLLSYDEDEVRARRGKFDLLDDVIVHFRREF